MSDIIVSKYGGSSVTCPESVERIRKITGDDARRRIIVVSAPGKKHPDDTKVTDMLIELAGTRNADLMAKIIDRYKEISPERDLGNLSALLKEQMNQQLEEEAYIASLKAFGEEACARMLAEALGAEYVDPMQIFVVSSSFDNAKILPESEHMVRKLLDREGVFVVPGFFGYTQEGLIATFSRNASDVTGAYIAAVLQATLYEVFTDTDGVLVANPGIVENPSKIPELTFKEMRDLAYSGFNILHPEATEPVAKKGVPVHIRNTSSYPAEGTYIVHDRVSDPEKPVVGVAYQDGFCSFNIERFGLNEGIGIARKILQVFEEEGISIEFMPSAIDDVSIVLKEDQLAGRHIVGNIIGELHSVLGAETSVSFQEHLGCIVVAGKGLKGYTGISAHIQLTLANAGINIRFISQGTQERCIVYGIDAADGKMAVNAVYGEYLR